MKLPKASPSRMKKRKENQITVDGIGRLESIDFYKKVFVFDNSITQYQVGNRLVFQEEYEREGSPYFIEALGENNKRNIIVKSVLEAGGIVRSNITGKTDYYVIGKNPQFWGKNYDYYQQRKMGKEITVVLLDNILELLGMDPNIILEPKLKNRIDLFDPEETKGSLACSEIYDVEEYEVTGDSEKDWSYSFSGNHNTVFLHDYLGDKDSITIPSKINGVNVKISDSGHFENSKAKTVKIPGCFKIIPQRLFSNNKYIKEVVVGNGVEEIESEFCINASNLTEPHFPPTIKRVGRSVLYGTKWSKNQGDEMILNGVLIHKYGTDDWSEKDQLYIVPEGVTCISEYAFAGMFEDGKKDPFYIRSIELPSSLRYICKNAFFCLNIDTIKIPSTFEFIGYGAFQGTGIWTHYKDTISDGLFIIRDLLHEILKYEKEMTIPEGIKTIGDGSITSNVEKLKLEELSISDTVEEIGQLTFSECKNLKNVHVGANLKKIGAECFRWCDKLSSFDLPASIVEIGEGAFTQSGLERITIPKNIKVIDKYTFSNCNKLKEVIIEDGVEEISDYAFSGCEALTTVILPITLKRIGYGAFKNCKSLSGLVISSSVECIANDAFEGCEQ